MFQTKVLDESKTICVQ